MTGSTPDTLCLLGCGNLGSAILDSLLNTSGKKPLFLKFNCCVRSQQSEDKLKARFSSHQSQLNIWRDRNGEAVLASDVIILGVDPSDIEKVLTEPGIREALSSKLLISIAAGWARQTLEETIYGSKTTKSNVTGRAWVIRTLPNIAAQVSQSLTAIEVSEPVPPSHYLQITKAMFDQIGRVVEIPPHLMNATTAVGGSTPAFFAIICDAMIDAAVAVGVPRELAHIMISQSMLGTAAMLQSGIHPALLKDQGTSPEGCTIGGLMVMEEAGVRGHIGRAVREAVTLARLMETNSHVNDTRH